MVLCCQKCKREVDLLIKKPGAAYASVCEICWDSETLR